MSDLISRKAVLDEIHKYFRERIEHGIYEVDVVDCSAHISKRIDKLPTASDVDKVVEWLEDGRQQALSMADESEYFLGQLALLNRVIPLVKGGGQGCLIYYNKKKESPEKSIDAITVLE